MIQPKPASNTVWAQARAAARSASLLLRRPLRKEADVVGALPPDEGLRRTAWAACGVEERPGLGLELLEAGPGSVGPAGGSSWLAATVLVIGRSLSGWRCPTSGIGQRNRGPWVGPSGFRRAAVPFNRGRAPRPPPRPGRRGGTGSPLPRAPPGAPAGRRGPARSAISVPRATRSAAAGAGSADGRWRADPERLGQLGVGGRLRRGGVDRTDQAVVDQAAHDDADLVVEGDPTPVLAPGAGPPAQPEPEQGQQLGQCPTAAAEHDAGAEGHGADAERRPPVGPRPPRPRTRRPGTRCPAADVSVRLLVAAVAVEADGGGADQYRRWARAGRPVRRPTAGSNRSGCAG